MKKLFAILFLLITAGVFAQQNSPVPPKYALVIGNGDYSRAESGGAGISRLNNPVSDANEMAATLQSLGFIVEKVENGSLARMTSAVDNLKRRIGSSRNSYGFFYYAGHAVQVGGENYLIPIGANIQNENNVRQMTFSVKTLLEGLSAAGNELNMIVLDACRDNPFPWIRSGGRGLAAVNPPNGFIIMYAAGANSVAADGTGQNSLFTGQLLKNLKTPGLNVRDVFDKTGEDVLSASRREQHPELSVRFFGAASAYLGPPPGASVVAHPAPASTAQAPSPIPDTMVRINGGTFSMGSLANEPKRSGYEGPQGQVTVSAFYIGKYEVTQKEYQAVTGTNPSNAKGDDLPVEHVSWYDAIEYCNLLSQKEGLTPAYVIDKTRKDPNNRSDEDDVRWVVTWNRSANGYRLPTEAEWEYACRAGTTAYFNTGNNITTNQANYNGNEPYNNNAVGEYRGKMVRVGNFAANPWGLHDMHGNVWEWCWDWYHGRTGYPSGARADPTGETSGIGRVMRGGSWYDDGEFLRSAYRGYSNPSERAGHLGFRLVRN